MTLLFDGLLDTYTTCRDCGDLMKVVDPDDHSHPTCEPQLTMLESLTAGWESTVRHGDVEAERFTAQQLREELRKPPNLIGAAIGYTMWDWPVFPLRPAGVRCDGTCSNKPMCGCPKKPAISKAKGGKGFKDATTEGDRIDAWWTRHPTHNIGLATGHAFDVIDIDVKGGGVQSFLKLLRDNDLPQCHGVVTTASGGTHLYVKATGKGNYAKLRPGVDYRGKGGYVVAPPSRLGPPGRSYTWLVEPSPIIKGGN